MSDLKMVLIENENKSLNSLAHFCGSCFVKRWNYFVSCFSNTCWVTWRWPRYLPSHCRQLAITKFQYKFVVQISLKPHFTSNLIFMDKSCLLSEKKSKSPVAGEGAGNSKKNGAAFWSRFFFTKKPNGGESKITGRVRSLKGATSPLLLK